MADALLGSPRILGRLPGPDVILRITALAVKSFGPHPMRGDAVVVLWGVLVAAVTILVAGGAGYWMDQLPWQVPPVFASKLLLLILILGQRPVFDAARFLARDMARRGSEEVDGRHAAGRWTIERLTNRMADGLIANIFWFLVAGFAGLLVFRAISVINAVGAPSGVCQTRDPLFRPAAWLYWLLGLPPAIIAVFIIKLAAIPAHPKSFLIWLPVLNPPTIPAALPLRSWPLNAVAALLCLSLKTAPDTNQTVPKWIGPKGGTARVGAAEIRRALLLFFAAWLWVIAALVLLLLWRLV